MLTGDSPMGRTRTHAPAAAVALPTLASATVALGVAACALVLWTARTVALLLLLAYTLAAAVRPGVDRLARLGVPRAAAVLAHLALVAGAAALLAWLFVPVALEQTREALQGHAHASGLEPWTFGWLREQAFASVEPGLRALAHPGAALATAGEALRVLGRIAFTLAAAVYWLGERDRLAALVHALLPRWSQETVRDAWLLADLRLGAVIRAKVVLVLTTATALSLAFWLIGLPSPLVVGSFAGLVEVVPVLGPLLAGVAAVATGLTVSWQLALEAALVVAGLRLLQDYVVNPRLFGRAVHLPPLAVLVAVSALAVLLGPAWVPLAVPLTALAATVLEAAVWGEDPGRSRVPAVLSRTTDTVARLRRRRDGGHR